jgi:H-type lectin domain
MLVGCWLLTNGLIKQWGIAQTNGGDTQYINFSLPYTAIPAVFLAPRFDESGTALVVQAYRIEKGRFVCNCKQADENTYHARPISWCAIGF